MLHDSRAGRFGTKGLAITFVSTEDDQKVLDAIQSRFEVAIPDLPDTIESSTYSTFLLLTCLVMFLLTHPFAVNA